MAPPPPSASIENVIRFLTCVVLVVALVWFGTTVRLGNRTMFGHLRAIWSTDEAQEMKRGVEQSARPMVERVKRGVEAGVREASKDDAGRPAAEPPKAERENRDLSVDRPAEARKPERKSRHHRDHRDSH